MIHTVKCFGIFNKAEVDVFLKFFCFFDDPVDVGNVISGIPEWSSGFLHFLQFQSEFGNKEFMI